MKWTFRLAVVIVLYFSAFWINGAGFNGAWRSMGVPAHSIQFVDLNVITQAIDCSKAGSATNVYENSCLSAQGINYNYPRIWLQLSALGWRSEHNHFIGWTLALLFFITSILVLRPADVFQATYCFALLVSPSILLLVERGNSDILIFMVLAVGMSLTVKPGPNSLTAYYLLLSFSAILKLYPSVLFAWAIKERDRKVRSLGVALALLFVLYLVGVRQEISAISVATPAVSELSYGTRVPLLALAKLQEQSEKKEVPRFVFARTIATMLPGYSTYPLMPSSGRYTSLKLTWTVFFAAVALTLGYKLRSSAPPTETLCSKDGARLRMYCCGSSIFLATYLLSVSFDYRMCFLLFCVPFLLQQLHQKGWRDSSAIVGNAALCGILMTTWLSRLPFFLALGLDEIINFALAVLLSSSLWRLATQSVLHLDSNISEISARQSC